MVVALMLLHGMVTNPNFDWPTVWMYLFNESVLSGIGWTLQLTVYAMVLATVLAVILAMMRKSAHAVLRGVSWFFIWFFRGTPVYTQLVFWGLFSRCWSPGWRWACAIRSRSSGASTPRP
jgi:polar amino acid transport system permease protein